VRRLRGDRRGVQIWSRYVTGSAFEDASPARRERLLANASAIFADLGSGGGEHVDESRFGEIEVPVTIVEAEQSPPFLRRSCARLKRLIPQARTLALEHSGHAVNVDAPDEVVAILRRVIAG
jgi:pimeloyl-ACP methyl ester carboxylesterase